MKQPELTVQLLLVAPNSVSVIFSVHTTRAANTMCLHEIPTSYPTQSEPGTNDLRGQSSQVQIMLLSLILAISKLFIDGANLLNTFVESFLGPEHLIKLFVSYIPRSLQQTNT